MAAEEREGGTSTFVDRREGDAGLDVPQRRSGSTRDRCPPVDLFSNLDTPKATRNPIEKEKGEEQRIEEGRQAEED